MSTKKTPRALYIPPPLRNNVNNDLIISNDVRKPSSISESSTVNLSVNQHTDEIEQSFKSLQLSDNPTEVYDGSKKNVFKSKLLSKNEQTLEHKTEPRLNLSDFQHIIELYNLPKDVENYQLESELAGFQDSGFYQKWVDDEHCLLVFSSSDEAHRALAQISGLFIKKIARSAGDWSMPYKKRPVTTSSIAHRIISSHLGIAPNKKNSIEDTTRDEQNKALLREARVREQAIRQAQNSMGEGDD
uniref:R3H domain-containing protein n=1 Tax=Trichobilharzia regenti TaxID=157069 RepID=A0AA85JGB7_TRIRE|nr:unnamed protein product [Trichobilharzia regenti]